MDLYLIFSAKDEKYSLLTLAFKDHLLTIPIPVEKQDLVQ